MAPMLLAAFVFASEAEPPRFTVSEVAPGVFAAIVPPQDASKNSGFVIGEGAVLVVDPFAAPEAAAELLAEIGRRTPQPVRWIVDTGPAGDRTGGSAVFVAAGAMTLARENGDRAPRPPGVTFRDAVVVWLGDRRVDILAREGPAGGDSAVSVPDARVVFGGGLVWREVVPDLAAADTAAWVRTLDGLITDFPAATFVPGRGRPGKALDVRFFRDYLQGMRLAVARALREGKSGPALLETVRRELQSRYGRWVGAEGVDGNIRDVEAELTGRKGSPAAPPK